MTIFLIILGFIVGALSSFFVIAAIADLIGGKSDTEPGILIGLLVFFSLTGFGGFYLAITKIMKNKKTSSELREQKILEVIISKGGRVTPVEIAAQTNLNVTDAKKELDKLCNSGAGEIQVTSEGNIVYVFQGIITDEDRITAKSALDI